MWIGMHNYFLTLTFVSLLPILNKCIFVGLVVFKIKITQHKSAIIFPNFFALGKYNQEILLFLINAASAFTLLGFNEIDS
jgi:hypothetical protein